MKKLTKEARRRLNNFMNIFVSIMALVTLIFGIDIFWTGFHNLDICHNEISIQNYINEDLRSINKSYVIEEQQIFTGEIWSLKDCYLMGLKGILQGFYISIGGAFVLGFMMLR